MDFWKSHELKKNEINETDKALQNKLNVLIGLLKDKVPTFDIRRLNNLRSFMLIQSK